MDEGLRSRILDVLQSQHLMTLATVRPDGYPQATIVNYVHRDLILYFATDATSQKAGNISLNNKVSVAIACETVDFGKLRGLSLSGIATRLLEREQARDAVLSLFRRLPKSKRFVPQDTSRLAVYSITPVAISLIDYSEGFGTSHLVEL